MKKTKTKRRGGAQPRPAKTFDPQLPRTMRDAGAWIPALIQQLIMRAAAEYKERLDGDSMDFFEGRSAATFWAACELASRANIDWLDLFIPFNEDADYEEADEA
jgi:hypothetical protein